MMHEAYQAGNGVRGDSPHPMLPQWSNTCTLTQLAAARLGEDDAITAFGTSTRLWMDAQTSLHTTHINLLAGTLVAIEKRQWKRSGQTHTTGVLQEQAKANEREVRQP